MMCILLKDPGKNEVGVAWIAGGQKEIRMSDSDTRQSFSV